MHPLTLDVGARFPPKRDRFCIVTEFDADFLQYGIGIVFNQRQTFFVQHLVFLDLSGNVDLFLAGTAATARCAACSSASGSATPAPAPAASGSFTLSFHYGYLSWGRIGSGQLHQFDVLCPFCGPIDQLISMLVHRKAAAFLIAPSGDAMATGIAQLPAMRDNCRKKRSSLFIVTRVVFEKSLF